MSRRPTPDASLALSAAARQQINAIMDTASRQIETVLLREVSRLVMRAQEEARQQALRHRDNAKQVLAAQGGQDITGPKNGRAQSIGFQPLLLRDVQIAQALGVHRNTIWNRVRQGKFPAPIKWDGTTVWRRKDVEDFVDALAAMEGEQ